MLDLSAFILRQMRQLTSINLLQLRQSQPNLISIQDWISCLQRISLQIHCLELLFICKLTFYLLEAGELVVRRPKLFELCQVAYVFQVLDFVASDIENMQVGVGVETGEVSDSIVGNIELFEVDEAGKTSERSEFVGWEGEDFEVGEVGDVLDKVLLEGREEGEGSRLGWSARTLISVILFFPSQSSSSDFKESRFSISYQN